jgi:hypothetical protein
MKFTLLRGGAVTNKESDDKQEQVKSEKEAKPTRQKASQMSSHLDEERSPSDQKERRRVKTSSANKEKRDDSAVQKRDNEAGRTTSRGRRRPSPERKPRKVAISEKKKSPAKDEKRSASTPRSASPRKRRVRVSADSPEKSRRKASHSVPARKRRSSRSRSKSRGRTQEASPSRNRGKHVAQKKKKSSKKDAAVGEGDTAKGALQDLISGDESIGGRGPHDLSVIEQEGTHGLALTSNQSLEESTYSLVTVEKPENDGLVAVYDWFFTTFIDIDCGNGYGDIHEAGSDVTSYAGTERRGSLVRYYPKRKDEDELRREYLAANANSKELSPKIKTRASF